MSALRTFLLVVFFSATAFGYSHWYDVKPLSDADLLLKSELKFTSGDRDKTFDTTLANLHTLFSHYKPAVDSSMKIVHPLVVSGPENHPVIKTSIEKCVFIICKTIDVVGDVTAQPRKGSCARDFAIYADLRKSTGYLSNTYDRLDVYVCLQPVGGDGTDMKMIVSAHQAQGYEEGVVQQTALDVLKLQAKPMLQAIRQTLISNGAVVK